jgi:hypothetical protein
MIGEKKQTVTFNGKEYSFRKLTMRDRLKIRKYIRQGKIKNIDETVEDSSIKKELIMQVINSNISETEFFEFLTSEDGVTYLFWHQTDIDKSYNDFLNEITAEEFKDLVDIGITAIMGNNDKEEPKKKIKK